MRHYLNIIFTFFLVSCVSTGPTKNTSEEPIAMSFSTKDVDQNLFKPQYLAKKEKFLKVKKKLPQETLSFDLGEGARCSLFTHHELLKKENELPERLTPIASCHASSAKKKAVWETSFESGFEWVQAKYHKESQSLFAILDYGIEGRSGQVPFLLTSDKGKTWKRLSYLVKRTFSDDVLSLKVDSLGVVVVFGEEHGKPLYYAISKDFGQSWSYFQSRPAVAF